MGSVQQLHNPAIIKQYLENDDTIASVLLVILIDAYGTEALNWAPETLVMELNEDFAADIPPANIDKLFAAISILTTDDFYFSVPEFIRICNALNGDGADTDIWDPADVSEIAWAVAEATMLDPDNPPFSAEVRGYMEEMLRVEGFVDVPQMLQPLLETTTPAMPDEYATDPAMFSSIYQLREDASTAIDNYVRQRAQALVTQLEHLPLRSGNAETVIEMFRK